MQIVSFDGFRTLNSTCNFEVKPIPSTLTINPSSQPGTVPKGSTFNLTGSISSNYNISSFKGEILRYSSPVQSCTINPYTQNINIESSAINRNLKFEELPTGDYVLRYTVTDTSGKTDYYTKGFKVITVSSTLSINPSSYPTSIYRGRTFNLTGSVTSNYRIDEFKGQILDGYNRVVQSSVMKPYTNSLNIASSTVNNNLLFDKLSYGNYTLIYTAKDSTGTTKTWKRMFRVK